MNDIRYTAFLLSNTASVIILYIFCQFSSINEIEIYIFWIDFTALVDTIQLVQSLRSFLPPPHIPVSSWKNEDKHRLDHTGTPYLPSL